MAIWRILDVVAVGLLPVVIISLVLDRGPGSPGEIFLSELLL